MDKIFAEGFSFKRNENAPDFVVGRLSLKVDEAIKFIQEHQSKGWINLNVKKARTGNFYIELDSYVTPEKENQSEGKSGGKSKPTTKYSAQEDDNDDELPF